jgi:hypothetical protein
MSDQEKREPEVTYPDEMTLVLKKPIKIKEGDEDKFITELHLEEPNVLQLKSFFKKGTAGDPVGAIHDLMANVAGVPPIVIDHMKSSDRNTAQQFLLYWVNKVDEAKILGKPASC